MMGGFGYGGFGWIGVILGFVIIVGGIVGLVFLALWTVRKLSSSTQPDNKNLQQESALDIAKARYAKGEITREEYQNILSDLGI